MLGLLLALQFAPLADSAMVFRVADSAGVPRDIMAAVAWMETRSGTRLNEYKGPGREQCDSAGCKRVCREIGRMQVNPCIPWRHPACKQLTQYAMNLRCGAAILLAARQRDGTWVAALQRYNGSGPQARRYLTEALAYIGWRQVTMGEDR